MNTNNYLPFDLETALKHPERVITRDGRKVQELHLMTSNKLIYHLAGVIVGNNDISTFTKKGKYNVNIDETKNDLFLLPEVKECWVNVYEHKDGSIRVMGFLSKEDAEQSTIDAPVIHIKTIRITNEPE